MNFGDSLINIDTLDKVDSFFWQYLPDFEVVFIAKTDESLCLWKVLDDFNSFAMNSESAEYLSHL